MNTVAWKFFSTLIIFLGIVSFAAAQAPVPFPQGFVLDQVGVLGEQEILLEQRLQQLETETTVEMAILIIPSLQGEDASAYATRVFDAWKIGKGENDNGLLIVVALEDRAYFIETGYGLEGTLPDSIVGRIARENMVPLFQEGKYAEGILSTLDALEGYIRADPGVVAQYQVKDPFTNAEIFGLGSGMIIVALLLFIFALVRIWDGLKNYSPRTGLMVANAVLLGFLSFWGTFLLGFTTFLFLGTYYGLSLISLIFIGIILTGKPLVTKFIPSSSLRAGGGYGGGGRIGGFGGGRGFGGGMTGGGGAGGKW